MSAIGTVSVSFIANSAGLMAGANAASKAFRALGGDSATLRASFADLQKIGGKSVADIGVASTAARAAFARLTSEAAALGAAFASGSATAERFKEGMRALVAESKALATATSNAASITREFLTDEQRYFEAVDRIKEAVRLGGLAEDVAARARAAALDTYMQAAEGATAQARATDDLAGSLGAVAGLNLPNPFDSSIADEFIASMDAMSIGAESAAASLDAQWFATAQAAGEARLANAALAELADTFARGAAITRQNATASEKHAEKMAELDDLLRSGAISQAVYDRAAKAAGDAMTKEAKSASTLDSALGGIKTRLNVLIGLDVAGFFGSIASRASGAVSSFVGMAQAEAEVITQTSKMAARIGVTYGEMAGLSLAAERSGVSLDAMKEAMTKADISLGKAANGSAEAAGGFEAIGLSAAQLNALSPAERFEAISTAIAKLPTEAQRAAASVRIFGKSGSDLLPIFDGGAGAIAAAREEAERFGTALTSAQGDDVKAMTSAFETAKTAIQGVVQQVTAYLAPAVTGVVTQFNEFIGGIGGANIGQAIGDGILAGAEYFAGIADWFVGAFGSTFEYLSAIGAQWRSVFQFLGQIGSAFAMVGRGMAAAFQLIVLGVTGVVEMALKGAKTVVDMIPGLAGSLDGATATVQGFNQGLMDSIDTNLGAAADNFSSMLGDSGKRAGQDIAQPLTNAVRGWRDQARLNAQKQDDAANTKRPEPADEAKKLQVTGVTEALKAIDSRSKEGVAEMFRLMRGSPDSAAQRTANASERTADATEKWLDRQDDVEFAIP
jgi:hypothetical protein